jgi:uncharacterized delta-60 repeat protein
MYKKVCMFLVIVVSSSTKNVCSNDFGQSVVLQADGKIVVAGYANASGKFAVARFNTDGTLDTAFNSLGAQPGTVATLVNNEAVSGYSVALQSDGKIVVAGYTNVSNKFAVARFNADGTLDTAFNASGTQPGTVATTVNGETAQGYSVAIQPLDGKIVVAGYTNVSNKFAVARFNTDGTLDTTFNPSPATQPGTVATTVNLETAQGYSVAIQPLDSKIVVAGYTNVSNKFAVARFNTDGTLDATFNPSPATQPGTLVTMVNSETARGYSVAIQPSDGKIVMTGYTNASGLVAVARFNTDGTLDTAFNSAGTQPGTVITTVDGGPALGRSVTIQPSDSKIVVAGYTFGDSKFAVVRFNTNGTLDTTTFNFHGLQPGTMSTTVDNTTALGYSVALQPVDGKIIVAGYTFGDNKFAVARFTTDGRLDNTTFNSAGVQPGTVSTTIDTVTVDEKGYSVALQQDDKIVVAGYALVSNANRFALARFTTNGILDTTFNAAGVQPGTVSTTIDNVAVDNEGKAVTIQPDGKIVIAGFARISGANRFAVARFTANGTLDTTFNAFGAQPGTVSTTVDGATALGYSVALQSDGKIIVAGYSFVSGANRFAVARFTANGTLDTTFNASGVQPGTASTTIDNGIVDNEGFSVAVQQDGKIVIAGLARISGANRFAVAQFTTNGTLDTTFNASGVQPGTVSTTIDNVVINNRGQGVAIQPDGKIVVGGFAFAGGVNQFAVARFMGSASIIPVTKTTTNVFASRLIAKYGPRLAAQH